ncbi:uncharacterized protein PWA37_001400 [Arxiozyma heterogenica]|uniref:Uncharacterized protein n=1 Tax=Arxiozyma heterogenica TaxID=278026 RepID=A0AAN7WT83_9SACH|nr:hypothetical protein RI543_002753 [Kazachstania heterogenica]
MSGSDGNYRMLILLEEKLDDNEVANESQDMKNEGKVTTVRKTSHEYLDEINLPFTVDELDILNEWFDKFDEEICIPNEGHIKYEISSDGLIILMLDKEIENVYQKILKFVENHQAL